MLLDILTPIAKSWPSQWCLQANDLSIQVHGGYGYTREFNVEQFYRDNRLNPIHEGTHGIQGIDLLGRKVVMQDGAAFKVFRAEVRRCIKATRRIDSLASYAVALEGVLTGVEDVTVSLHASGDLSRTLANASVYLEAFGHLVIAWIWLQQANVAEEKRVHGAAFYSGKLQACKFFFNWELPKVHQQISLLESTDTTSLDMKDAWF